MAEGDDISVDTRSVIRGISGRNGNPTRFIIILGRVHPPSIYPILV